MSACPVTFFRAADFTAAAREQPQRAASGQKEQPNQNEMKNQNNKKRQIKRNFIYQNLSKKI